jgi:hypothetical protein
VQVSIDESSSKFGEVVELRVRGAGSAEISDQLRSDFLLFV